jgi:hypothetical protein
MVLPNLLERFGADPQMTDSNLGLQRALLELTRADACARSERGDPWEFAVEMDRLFAQGLTTSDLRWLVKKGFVEHAREVTRRGDTARRFKPCCNVSFERRTCFLLTRAGALLATAQGLRLPPDEGVRDRGSGTRSAISAEPETSHPHSPIPSPSCVPSWDPNRRVLCWNGRIVKQFRVPSPTQEAILAAFEEEGWPAAIDDPLPPHLDQEPKRRMRNTIQHLNSNQKNRLLCFHGDGSGQRILWELTEDSAEQPAVPRRLSIHAA